MKKILALILALVLAVGVLASCAAGEKGEQGIQGEQGLQGEKGEQGIQGIQGEQGIQGIQGPAGANGTNGIDGNGILKVEIIDGYLWITYTNDPENPVKIGKVIADEYLEFTFYKLIDGTYAIAPSDKFDSDVLEIPSNYNGIPVTVIASDAFRGMSNLKEIVIPESVTNISSGAFVDCPIEKATIPAELLNAIPNGSLKTLIIKGGSQVKGSFSSDVLESVVICEGVESLPNYSFDDCSALTSVTVGDSLISTGYNSFKNSAYYNDEANWENGILYVGNHLVKADTDISGNVTVREGTLSITTSAFEDCINLTGITLPDSVEVIGVRAFEGCSSLASINLGNGLKYLDSSAFDDTAFFKNSANRIGGALYCGNVLIDLDTSVSGTFNVKEGTTVIGSYAFFDCNNVTEINIPASAAYISSDAIHRCSKLENINVDPKNPAFKSIDGVLYSSDNVLIRYPVGNSRATFTIPEGTVAVESYAFYNFNKSCEIIFPDSLKRIELYAFNSATGIKSLTFGDGLEYIGNSAFAFCTGIKTVNLGKGLKVIDNYAFYSCTNLTMVSQPIDSEDDFMYEERQNGVYLPYGVTYIGKRAFSACDNIKYVSIPASVVYIGSSGLNSPNVETIYLDDVNGWVLMYESSFTTNGIKMNAIDLKDKATAVRYFTKYSHSDTPGWADYDWTKIFCER